MSALAYMVRTETGFETYCAACWFGVEAVVFEPRGEVVTCSSCSKVIGEVSDPREVLSVTARREVFETALAALGGLAYVSSKVGDVGDEFRLRTARDELAKAMKS